MSNKEDVYNHLHESDKEDRSDYYDHAGPVPYLTIMEEGYGVLTTVCKGSDKSTRSYNTVDGKACIDIRKSMTTDTGNKKNSDYFILEP